MQVKKFEAKTMREALALVKTDFGPEAIVIATKEKQSGYGGKSTFEITAAISKKLFQKKKLAELKLNQKNKEKFISSSAKNQKLFIEKVFNDFQNKTIKRELTKTPYAFIEEEEGEEERKKRSLNQRNEEQIKDKKKSLFSPPDTQIKKIKHPPFSLIKRRFGIDEKSKNSIGGENFSLEKKSFDLKKEALLSSKDFKPSLKNQTSPPSSPSLPASLRPTSSDQLESNALDENEKDSFVSRNLFPRSSLNTSSSNLNLMYKQLAGVGMSDKNINDILEEAKQKLSPVHLENKNILEAFTARFFLQHIKLTQNVFDKKYQIFIGSSGSGKTTALMQLASRMVMEGKKNIILLAFEAERIGSFEIFKIFSNILNVPSFRIRSKKDLESKEKELTEADFILIDFFSLNLNSKKHLKEMLAFFNEESRRIHYVESLMFDEKNSFHLLKSSNVPFDDVIFTHLNESKFYGKIYNFQKMFSTPLYSFCFGSRIPDDFEWATKERFVDLVFQLVNWKK